MEMRLGSLAGGKLLAAIELLLLICLLLPSAEATGHIVWQKCLGGPDSDIAHSFQQAADGGYIVAGGTHSWEEGVDDNNGYWDYWIVKLDQNNSVKWKKCFGGIWDETAYSIQQTVDGGYIVAGSTHSKNGDVSGIHRDDDCKDDICKSCPADFWVVKLSSSGKREWRKCLGGTKDDVAYSVQQTKEGGYIVAGSARSNDGDVTGLHGGKDFWVVKVVEGEINCTITAPDSLCPNSIGNVASTAEPGAVYVWTIGNGTITSANNTQSITFTAEAYGPVSLNVYVEKYGYWDKGYKDIPVALANCRWTSKSPVCINSRVFFYGPAGMDSYQWDFGDGSQGSGRNANNTYSAPGNYKVRLNTTLRGCSKICTGTVRVLSGPKCSWTSKSYVCEDEKVQFTGPAMMDSCYRELGDGQNSTAEDPSHLYSHLGTRNVNLTVSCCGSQRTGAGPVEVRQPTRANRSCIEWQKCLGGSEDDEAKSVRRTADGGYIVAGYTKSNNGDVSGCHGKKDFWVVKLNATGNLTWQRCLGGSGDDRAQSVRQTADGGYIVAGYTYSNNGDVKGLHGESDYWVVKLDPSGNLTWQSCLGGSSQDEAHDIQQTADGGYIVAGGTHSNDGNVSGNHGDWDWWIVRLDPSGNLVGGKCLGGSDSDAANSVQQIADGRYVVAGYTDSEDGDVGGNHGGSDYWIVQLDEINAPDVVCSGSTGNVASVALSGASYAWYITNGEITSASNAQSITFTAGISGTVSLRVIMGKDDHWDNGYKDIAINLPDCSWTSNAPVCDGTPVQFTGPSGMDSYNWDFGDGAVSSEKDPSHLYAAPRNYTVNLTVTKAGCSRTCSGSVFFRPMPDCSWTSNAPVCDGTIVQFNGPAGMDNYQWDFGDGQVSSREDSMHLYRGPGTYAAKLTVTQCGIVKSCPGTIKVKPQANCSWSSNAPTCNGTPVQFKGPAGMEAYRWEFGDGKISLLKDPSHLYPAPGNYSVSLWTKKEGCTKICKGSVVVAAPLDCSWTSNAPVCNGTAVRFTGPTGMDSYLWEFGDGAVSSDKDPSHLYRAPGTYTVNLTAAKGSCRKKCTKNVEVRTPAACGRAICIEWQRCLGGRSDEYAQSVQQTADGGYIAAGYTQSNDGDVSGNHSAKDFWVVKLDPSGNKTWQKCLGGSGNDEASSVRQTAEGGYVVAGATGSNDYDVSGNHGAKDFWVVKLNESGNLIWQKCLGGSSDDEASSVRQTADEGYVVAGYTKSNDGNVSGNHGGEDFWIVKLDNLGKLVWQKCLGGKLGEQGMPGEQAWSIQQTADGGYVVAGHATSPDGDVGGTHGKLNYSDYWVVKLDASGNKTWQKCLGGRYIDEARSIQQTADGGYVVAGYGYSDDGDATGNHGNTKDYWVVKLNRSGNLEWQKSLGGFKNEEAHSVSQTADGGYVVVGYTESNDGDVSGKNNARDLWAVKLDLSGNLVWQKCLGGSGTDEARSILTIDGGYLVAGATASNDNDVSGNHGGLDFWVVKLREIDCTITAPDVVCSGSTGNSASTAESGAAYSWSITNGEVTSASNAQSINFTAGSQGTATLRVIVIGDGCSKDCSKEISILSRPDCSWTSNAPVCNGTPAQFTGPAGMDAYQWDFGDGAASSAQDASHLYSAPGTYSVNLKATKDGCSKTCAGSVEVRSQTDCGRTSNVPAPNGTAAQFAAPVGTDPSRGEFVDCQASPREDRVRIYPG